MKWVKIITWSKVAGNVYKAAISGYDSNCNVAKYNSTELTQTTGTSPSSNQWSIVSGYIYTDVAGDPDSGVFEVGSRKHKI